MSITVRLPATLRTGPSDTIEVHDRVRTIADLIEALDRRIPGFLDQLDDSVFNFAVNDEMLLHRARDRQLTDGDIVEIIPTISGGARGAPVRPRLTRSGLRSTAVSRGV